MGKAKRKMRPQPPLWWTLDNDNCWFCKNRNNCGNCKLLKRQRAEERKKMGRLIDLHKRSLGICFHIKRMLESCQRI